MNSLILRDNFDIFIKIFDEAIRMVDQLLLSEISSLRNTFTSSYHMTSERSLNDSRSLQTIVRKNKE